MEPSARRSQSATAPARPPASASALSPRRSQREYPGRRRAQATAKATLACLLLGRDPLGYGRRAGPFLYVFNELVQLVELLQLDGFFIADHKDRGGLINADLLAQIVVRVYLGQEFVSRVLGKRQGHVVIVRKLLDILPQVARIDEVLVSENVTGQLAPV